MMKVNRMGLFRPTERMVVRTAQSKVNIWQSLASLWQHREVLWIWTLRDVKVRYKQAAMGAAWAIIQPFFLMVVLTIVFSMLVKVPSGNIAYPVFSYAALLPWTFFVNSLNFATASLVNNSNLVTKIYFPREVMPFASVIACALDLAIGFILLVPMMLFYHVGITPYVLLLPVVLVVQVLFTAAICLFAAAGNVFYRDIRFIVPLLVQVWFYITPIIYPTSMVPPALRSLFMLNPMTGIIEAYRAMLDGSGELDFGALGLAAIVSLALFFLSYWMFKNLERRFADVI